MNKGLIGFFAIIVLGSAGLVGYYFAKPLLEEKFRKTTSDSRNIKGTISVGIDSWIGYYPLCSQEMSARLRREEYRLKCVDDNADYPARMAALSRGDLDFAVATVDSFLLNGPAEGFPGVIVAVIDESQGGDAIVARKDAIQNIQDLKNKTGYKVAFTPNSPSEHLLKSVAVHFEVPALGKKGAPSRVETNGSGEALRKLLNRETEAAVLWEPDVSKALSDPDFVKILGSEQTQNLIVDILIVGRRFLADRPDLVRMFLSQYFRALKTYRDDPESLNREIVAKLKLPAEQAGPMLKGARFMTLYDNAVHWFGISDMHDLGREGLTDAIAATSQILMDSGDFSEDPVPDSDPYRLQNRGFVKELYEKGLPEYGVPADTAAEEDDLAGLFPALTDAEWDGLREIGTLKIRPVTFQSGTSELDLNGKAELDKAANNLKHYPRFRLVIKGHTGLSGDPRANFELSSERAESVRRYFEITYGVDPDRLRTVGFGADRPLPRLPGESDRSYNYRLPRVELGLVAETF